MLWGKSSKGIFGRVVPRPKVFEQVFLLLANNVQGKLSPRPKSAPHRADHPLNKEIQEEGQRKPVAPNWPKNHRADPPS